MRPGTSNGKQSLALGRSSSVVSQEQASTSNRLRNRCRQVRRTPKPDARLCPRTKGQLRAMNAWRTSWTSLIAGVVLVVALVTVAGVNTAETAAADSRGRHRGPSLAGHPRPPAHLHQRPHGRRGANRPGDLPALARRRHRQGGGVPIRRLRYCRHRGTGLAVHIGSASGSRSAPGKPAKDGGAGLRNE